MAEMINYKTQAVRDLAHSCFGPSLVKTSPITSDAKHCHLQLSPQRLEWLTQLDQDPAALIEKLESINSTRLGIYFEGLWQFFIDADPALELIAANLPVREKGRTLGEFDLIYYSKTNRQHYHLELAVKFYLGLSGTSTQRQDHWWGPNCKDRLDLKLKRLFEHQCLLSDQQQGRKELQQFTKQPIEREIAVKGMLFYPVDSSQQPQGIDVDHQRGAWLSLDQFKAISISGPYWKLLTRSQWLSPAVHQQSSPPGEHQDLLRQLECYFMVNERPVMVCQMEQAGDACYETGRYYITRNNWPPLN